MLDFLGLYVVELGRGTRQTDRHWSSFHNDPPYGGWGIITRVVFGRGDGGTCPRRCSLLCHRECTISRVKFLHVPLTGFNHKYHPDNNNNMNDGFSILLCAQMKPTTTVAQNNYKYENINITRMSKIQFQTVPNYSTVTARI